MAEYTDTLNVFCVPMAEYTDTLNVLCVFAERKSPINFILRPYVVVVELPSRPAWGWPGRRGCTGTNAFHGARELHGYDPFITPT